MLLLLHLKIRVDDPGQELPSGWLTGCFLAVLAGFIISHIEPLPTRLTAILRISLFVYVFLAMCSMNRSSLYLASGGKDCISGRMRRNNWLLVVGMFAIAAAVAVVTSKFQIWGFLLGWILQLIAKIAELYKKSPNQELVPSATSAPTTVPTTEPPATAPENIQQVVNVGQLNLMVVALVLVLIIGGIVMFVLAGVIWSKRTKKRKLTFTGDEITSTRKKDKDQRYQSAQLQEEKPIGWFSPAKRIRRRYKRLTEQNPQWLRSSTARENLIEEAAKIYEKTRYSSHAVTRQDAEEFKNKTK